MWHMINTARIPNTAKVLKAHEPLSFSAQVKVESCSVVRVGGEWSEDTRGMGGGQSVHRCHR